MQIALSYNEFKSIITSKLLKIQYVHQSNSTPPSYDLYCFDDSIEYLTSISSVEDVNDFETNYKANANKPEKKVNADGFTVIAPTIEDTNGLYPKKKTYRIPVVANELTFYDIEVVHEKQICGGEYKILDTDIDKIHVDDFVEFSIVDKNDVYGAFILVCKNCGLPRTVEQVNDPCINCGSQDRLSKAAGDVLELCKFILTDYIVFGCKSNGYYNDLTKSIKGTNKIIPGLFMRIGIDSHGLENYTLMTRLHYYE